MKGSDTSFLLFLFLVGFHFHLNAQICDVKLPFYEHHKKDGSIKDESLNISKDGSKVVYAANKRIVLLDRHYGDRKSFLEESSVSCTALSHDAQILAVGVSESINLYNTENLERTATIKIEKSFNCLSFFGDKLIGISDNHVYCYSKTGELQYQHFLGYENLLTYLLRRIDDNTALVLLKSNTRKIMKEMKDKQDIEKIRNIEDKLVKFNINTKESFAMFDAPYKIYDIEVSPDGKYIGLNGYLGKEHFLEVLFLDTYKLHYKYQPGNLYNNQSLSFSPDSRYIAMTNASRTMGVRIIDVQRKMPLGDINIGVIKRIHYSIDGVDTVQFDRKNNSIFVGVYDAIRNYELQCIF